MPKRDRGGTSQEINMSSLQEALIQLQDVHLNKDTKELIIKRMQHGKFIIKNLFDNPGEYPKDITPEKQYLEELLKKQCTLVSEISKNLKTVEELKDKSAELKNENFELMNESRKLMQELKQKNLANKLSYSNETKSLCAKIDNVNHEVAATKGILQGLIIGSGVDWAKDPKLEELVMKLGEIDTS